MTTPDLGLWHAMWAQAEGDVVRYRAAWLSARSRAEKQRRWRDALNDENEYLHDALAREKDRNRALMERCHQADTKIAELQRGRVGWGWGR